MYELGEAVSSFANLAFGLIGVWMAHGLYRTTRKHWQAVLAWILIFIVWTVGAAALRLVFPLVPYVRLSMLVGFSGIFVYLYLFTDIPLNQRVFTYFMVDTSQTLLVLLARVSATLAAQYLHWNGDIVFLAVYLPVTAGFLVLFRLWLRGYILTALQAFRAKLSPLTLFAAICYVTLLLQVDTWGPWPPLDVWSVGGTLGMIALPLAGYTLAFRTLSSILAQKSTEAEARRLGALLTLSEQYYGTLVARIEQSNVQSHDLRHHVNVLSGLCRGAQWEALTNYVLAMGAELPTDVKRQYCEHSAVNALLEYYASLCQAEGIAFQCQVHLSQLGRVQPIHLCIIFGNALQNALEAVRRLPEQENAYLSIRVVIKEGRLAIAISNPFSGSVLWDEAGDPVTNKEESGHGMGVSSIRETARHYGGWCGCQTEGQVFTLSVTFRLDDA